MKLYKIIDHFEDWFGNNVPETDEDYILTEHELNDLAAGWGKSVDELMNDLEAIPHIEWWCGLTQYDSRDDADYACDVTDLDTTGMLWNGETYHDRDANESWMPVQECSVDENGDVESAETIGYRRSIV